MEVRTMWDVLVVGARCAGAAAALRFARAGHRVLVLDKGRLGSETLSTHVLVPPAIARLDALDLLAEARATGAPPVGTFLVEFHGAAYPIPSELLCVRRTSLDPILVRAAMDAGGTVRHGVTVDTLLWEDGRVVGVRGRDRAGGTIEERARLVVGADGRHSLVARQVHAREYNVLHCTSGVVYAYFRGIGPTVKGSDVLQFASGPRCEVLCCPCDGGLHVVLLIVGRDEFAHLSLRQPALFEDRLRTIPTFAPRLAGAERVGRLHPGSPRELRGYFRQPYGAGWALAGDAGYYAHPASANGIADALRSAEILHALVEQAWATGRPAEACLEEYQRTRDAENLKAFQFSYRLSSVNPFDDPEVAAAFTGGAAAREQAQGRYRGGSRPADRLPSRS
jgi:flavin-dependent dehydrogenase